MAVSCVSLVNQCVLFILMDNMDVGKLFSPLLSPVINIRGIIVTETVIADLNYFYASTNHSSAADSATTIYHMITGETNQKLVSTLC